MWDRKELKQKGKAAFLANYWKTVLVAFLMTALVLGATAYGGSSARGRLDTASESSETVDTSLTNDQSIETVEDAIAAIGEATNATPEQIDELNQLVDAVRNDSETQEALLAILAIIGGVLLLIVLIASLLRLLVFNPLEVGCESFFLRNAEAPAALDELGRGFHPYWRSVGTLFLRGLFLFLWSLLLIVPGVIKSYSYRMVPYILADDPEIGGMEAITLSRRMMDGQKWKAFVLDLSFLGWLLLSALTLGLLGLFFVNPYRFCTNAELYRTLKAQR